METDLDVTADGCTVLMGGVSTAGSFESEKGTAAVNFGACDVVRSAVRFPSGAVAWSVLGGDHDSEPVALEHQKTPACPLDSRHAHAVIQAVVGADGGVGHAWSIATNHTAYAADATDAVRTWRFQPGRLDGTPVASIFTIELSCGRSD